MARPSTGRGAERQTGWPDWADPDATRRLQDAVRRDHVGQSYLLAGPRGTGKAALAQAFAQALACTNPDSTDRAQPCGVCRGCRNVMRLSHPDVERINLETQAQLADKPGKGGTLTIDSVRRLRSSAALLPLEMSRRLLVIDDAETLLEPAQQALLKTLEEPPTTITLMLLSDEAEALLPTVRSRCQIINVRPVSEPRIVTTLQAAGIGEELAREIAVLSRGRVAWALEAARDAKELQARRLEREQAANWLRAAPYERLVAAYRHGEQFAKKRGEVIGVVQAAIQLLREAVLHTSGAGPNLWGEAPLYDGLVAVADLGRALTASLRCLDDLDANVRPRLALEAMVLAWPKLEASRG